MNSINQTNLPSDAATVAKFKKLLNFQIPADVEKLVRPKAAEFEQVTGLWNFTAENYLKIVRDAERDAFRAAIKTGTQPAVCRSEADIYAGQDNTSLLFREELARISEAVLPFAHRVVVEFCESLTGAANNLENSEKSAAEKFDAVFEPSMTLRTMRHLAKILPTRLPEKLVGHASPKSLFQGLL